MKVVGKQEGGKPVEYNEIQIALKEYKRLFSRLKNVIGKEVNEQKEDKENK